jgi:integrase
MQASIINAARGSRLYAPIAVDYTTGLRRGELLGLRWSDINFAAGTLTVMQVVQVVKKLVSFKEPKSERSVRTIRL